MVWSRRIPHSLRGLGAVSALLLACLWLTACERKPDEAPPEAAPDRLILTPVAFADLPGWTEDSLADALPALLRSCGRLTGVPDGRELGPQGPSGPVAGTVADWREACAALASVPTGDHGALKSSLEQHFAPLAAANNDELEGVFTGYYEAELRGALTPNERHGWPLYAKPPDLVTADLGAFRADLEGVRLSGRVENGRLVPYRERAEIDDGALVGQGLELIWVDDPVDAFILHVQGSGRVILDDGRVVRVGFAATNGLPFTAIGRVLLDEGKVAPGGASVQGIREWLRANPAEAQEIMRRNRRFTFFRIIEGDGPIGGHGVPLTPGRSLAVDPAFLPLGAPLWLDTTWPGSGDPLRRLMVAQDIGGAIKGPVRGDFFWGYGEEALHYAGRMKQTGRYFLLLPKAVAQRYAATG
jgi:membrane-bound lytic murein transglycosylase A